MGWRVVFGKSFFGKMDNFCPGDAPLLGRFCRQKERTRVTLGPAGSAAGPGASDPDPPDPCLSEAGGAQPAAQPSHRVAGRDTALFRRLVLGWIEADFRVQIRIF